MNSETQDKSLKELFLIIIEEIKLFFLLLNKNIKKSIIISVIGGVIGFSYAFFSKPIYKAELSFLVPTNVGTSMLSGFSGLSNFLGSGTNIGTSLNRIEKIIKSDLLISKSLLKNVSINNVDDLLINHLISDVNINKILNNDKLSGLTFKQELKNMNDFSFDEIKAFKFIKDFLVNEDNGILESSVNQKTGIVNFELSYYNELLVVEIANSIYESLSIFYNQQNNFGTKSNLEALERKVDSIRIELEKVQNIHASYIDKSKSIILQGNKLDLKKYMLDEQLLTVMYGEAIKNLETFKVMDQSVNTSLTIIEKPFVPIEPIKKGKIKFFIIGLLISLMTSLFYYRVNILLNN